MCHSIACCLPPGRHLSQLRLTACLPTLHPTSTIVVARERVTDQGYLNADGFGLGWYPLPLPASRLQDQGLPCVFTRCVWASTARGFGHGQVLWGTLGMLRDVYPPCHAPQHLPVLLHRYPVVRSSTATLIGSQNLSLVLTSGPEACA